MATLRVNGFRSACRARTARRFAEGFSGETLPGVQALANGVTETTSPGLDFRPQTCCVIKQDLTIVTFPIYPYSFDLSRIAGAKIREVGYCSSPGFCRLRRDGSDSGLSLALDERVIRAFRTSRIKSIAM